MHAETTVIFQAGGARFAIRGDEVVRILAVPRLSVPPAAPPALAGFFAEGDELVCTLRLSVLLDLTNPEEPGLYDHLILLRRDAPRIALLVDRAQSVLEAGKQELRPLTQGLTHREFITAQLSRDGETIPLIDTERLISEFERGCVAHFLAEEERRRRILAEAEA